MNERAYLSPNRSGPVATAGVGPRLISMSGVGTLEPFYSTAFAEVGDFLRFYANGSTFSEPASAVHHLVECLPELLPLV